jgi:hypothetical protein
MGNWMRGTPVAWVVLWSVAGVASLAGSMAVRERAADRGSAPTNDATP